MAGHRHALARSSAPWSKESITPTPPLLSYPRMAVLYLACLGTKRATAKGWNNSAARTLHV
jgi:hypothetical protein